MLGPLRALRLPQLPTNDDFWSDFSLFQNRGSGLCRAPKQLLLVVDRRHRTRQTRQRAERAALVSETCQFNVKRLTLPRIASY